MSSLTLKTGFSSLSPFAFNTIEQLRRRNNKHIHLINLVEKYNTLQECYANLRALRAQDDNSSLTHSVIAHQEQIINLQKENQKIKTLLHEREQALAGYRDKVASLRHDIERMEGHKKLLLEELDAKDRVISELELRVRRNSESKIPSSPSSVNLLESPPVVSTDKGFIVNIPQRVENKYDGQHDISALTWSPSGKSFVTGGTDKQVKLWEYHDGTFLNKKSNKESRGVILSVDYHQNERLLLTASGDGLCRVWQLPDLKLLHTLSGHDDKVSTAKFMESESDIVSGSHDTTLKLWDINRHHCTRTFHTRSRCNDLVYVKSVVGIPNIVSCHHDKMIRFWDARANHGRCQYDMPLGESVISLALSPSSQMLLACCKDTIRMADLRMLRFHGILSDENFSSANDRSKAVFSPDGKYVLSGSKNGSLLIWGVESQKVVEKLKGHTQSVTSCDWHPEGKAILSSDKAKHIFLWSNHCYI